MSEQAPNPFDYESPLQRLENERMKDGWRFVGPVFRLTETKFSPEAKFEQVQVRTEEDIKKTINFL